ncbi:uncharacterized protein BXZ73DRAFT_78672 [Epithele typhae]|uniref:uncharacterized protein n=1 Tax=Epithele typhae TaxID=378194 RepID=UPI002008D0A5|nr:uncharacterized protein BXZ73DRAFT_78672 [Epithele typhae]KAH9926569.1 hypothetical protein BXZ73DRAFT_78672 [Epithele typhae]
MAATAKAAPPAAAPAIAGTGLESEVFEVAAATAATALWEAGQWDPASWLLPPEGLPRIPAVEDSPNTFGLEGDEIEGLDWEVEVVEETGAVMLAELDSGPLVFSRREIWGRVAENWYDVPLGVGWRGGSREVEGEHAVDGERGDVRDIRAEE